MPPKTTSSTLVVGDYKYIFLNRPDTQHIDYIRFKSPDDDSVQTGKVGTSDRKIFTNEGPIDTLVYADGSVRLYYIGINADNQNVVREVKLNNANSDQTDPQTAWTWTDKDLLFENKVLTNTRLVDTSSFLAVTSRNGQPALSYKTNNQDKIQYVYFNGTKFLNTTLDLPN